jgi:beta-phosphoglucomutase-like phosphatase (HAD superfamily)
MPAATQSTDSHRTSLTRESTEREPRGIIFDCDGTLADTMPLHWLAWRAIAKRHNFKMSEERFWGFGGIPTREIIRVLSTEQGVTLDREAVIHEKERAFLELLGQVRPIEPVVAVARRYHGRIPLAIASGGTHVVIGQILGHLGIRQLFDVIVSSEDVVRPKPAPDVFLEAARRIGVPPQFCRGYEDMDLGLEAIRAAGMEAVDVRDLLGRDPQRA